MSIECVLSLLFLQYPSLHSLITARSVYELALHYYDVVDLLCVLTIVVVVLFALGFVTPDSEVFVFLTQYYKAVGIELKDLSNFRVEAFQGVKDLS